MIQATRTAKLIGALLGVFAIAVAALWWTGFRFGFALAGDLDRARNHLAAGEASAAVVQLKSVLQAQPDSAEARFLLARAYLAMSQAAAAEAELGRALAAGMPETRVAAPMTEALLALRRSQEAIDRFAKLPPADAADAAALRTQLARAYVDIGNPEQAQAELLAALGHVKGFRPALLMQARFVARAGDHSAAMAMVDGVLADEPHNADAWILKGDLLRGRPDGTAAAVDAYRKALAQGLRPLPAHAGLIGLLVQSGDMAAARSQWGALAKDYPGNGVTTYLDAFLALKTGDPTRAQAATQRLLRAGAESAPVLVMAGQAEYHLGALAQAQTHFAKAVTLTPAAAVPRQHLALVLLRLGQHQEALDVLRPLVASTSSDGVAWSLAARAHLMGGDFDRASAAIDRAARLQPDSVSARTDRAQMAIRTGREDDGLAELASIAASDAGITSDLALISQRLRRREFTEALAAIDGLERKQPDTPLADDLRGQIALARNDRAMARRHFEQAIAKNPLYVAAVQRLALIDVVENESATAVRRFDEVLQRDPGNVPALLSWVDLNWRLRVDPQAGAERLEAAVRAKPLEPALRLAQIDHHLRSGSRNLALAAAQSAAVALPADAAILERLAALLQASGDKGQAIVAWRKLAAMQPATAALQLRAAAALRALGVSDEADALLGAALRAEPDSKQAQRHAVTMAIQQGQHAKALEVARSLQRRLPAEALGFTLEGDVEASQARWGRAAAAYAAALKKRDPGTAAVGMYLSLRNAKGKADAERFEQAWLRDHPDDAGFLLFSSQVASEDQAFDVAEARLRRVIEVVPTHALAHNNLAFLLWRQQKGGALPLAERATELAPNVAAFLDTLASILADEQQLERALRTQSRALDLAPNSGSVRLNLAKLQIRAGDTARALDELNRLARLGDRFSGQAEVARLKAELERLRSDGAGLQQASRQGDAARSGESAGFAATLTIALLAGGVSIGLPLVVLIAALKPRTFQVERSVAVKAPAARVFDLLQQLRQWEQWSGMAPFGPSAVRSFTGPLAGRGSVCRWHAERGAVTGALEVVHCDPLALLSVESSITKAEEVRHLYKFRLTAADADTTLVHCVVMGPATFRARLLDVLDSVERRTGRRVMADLKRLKHVAETVPASQMIDGAASPVAAA